MGSNPGYQLKYFLLYQLIQHTTTYTARFMKIYTNCMEVQNTRFASFEFDNNFCKSLKNSTKSVVIFWVNWWQNILIWQKITCNHNHYFLLQVEELRIVIWHIFWRRDPIHTAYLVYSSQRGFSWLFWISKAVFIMIWHLDKR